VGFGNVEDNVLRFPDGEVRAAAFRSFDPATGTWSIWWLDGRNPHNLDVPVVGRFAGHLGVFYADDTLNGAPVKIRFRWNANPRRQSDLGAGVLGRRRRHVGNELDDGVRPQRGLMRHGPWPTAP
jgi:hypothetical protein